MVLKKYSNLAYIEPIMTPIDLHRIAQSNDTLTKEHALDLLSDTYSVWDIMSAAYWPRKRYYANQVRIHILNNSQNGHCPEDCHYCVQSKDSKVPIEKYGKKEADQLIQEAGEAYKNGAFRYCMVFSGRGPSKKRVAFLSDVIKKIKETYPIEVCLSPGLLSREDAKELAAAGLDRYNHNLNTSEGYYNSICTTHTYHDRLETLENVSHHNINICSGMIVGMGESHNDIVDVAFKLKELKVISIPINFYLYMAGNTLGPKPPITPVDACKIVGLFRLINPQAEIRLAAGREAYLQHLQPMALMAANSLFAEGYLNITGSGVIDTINLIESSGFTVDSHVDLSLFRDQQKTLASLQRYNKTELNLKTKAELKA
jgi:biotin synthase